MATMTQQAPVIAVSDGDVRYVVVANVPRRHYPQVGDSFVLAIGEAPHLAVRLVDIASINEVGTDEIEARLTFAAPELPF